MRLRYLLILGGVLLVSLPAIRLSLFLTEPVTPSTEQIVTVAPGSPLSRVVEQLNAAGVIDDPALFLLLGRWEGAGARIRTGEYSFSEPARPAEVLQRLVAGDVRRIRLTVPEGLTVREVAERVAASGLGEAETFLAASRDKSFMAALGLDGDSLEGYLFPETYLFETGRPEREMIRAMVAQLEKTLTPELLNAAKERGLNRHQLLTLASIIQKEAGNSAEMPQIAAVFHNRLRRGIPLQADPTVIYGIADFDGNLTRAHLQTPGPYNSYLNRGLPPGPISNPGLAALQAAAFPAVSRALYFVAKGDGTHQFSNTLEEHNLAVRRYQLKRHGGKP